MSARYSPYVIDRQEVEIGLAAADALSAVCCEDLVLEPIVLTSGQVTRPLWVIPLPNTILLQPISVLLFWRQVRQVPVRPTPS